MVVHKYRRIDENGKCIETQLWKGKTKEITKIRHVVYWEENGELFKYQSEITPDHQDFIEVLKKEKEVWQKQAEDSIKLAKELENQIKNFESRERLSYTARLLKEGWCKSVH